MVPETGELSHYWVRNYKAIISLFQLWLHLISTLPVLQHLLTADGTHQKEQNQFASWTLQRWRRWREKGHFIFDKDWIGKLCPSLLHWECRLSPEIDIGLQTVITEEVKANMNTSEATVTADFSRLKRLHFSFQLYTLPSDLLFRCTKHWIYTRKHFWPSDNSPNGCVHCFLPQCWTVAICSLFFPSFSSMSANWKSNGFVRVVRSRQNWQTTESNYEWN